MSHDRQSQMSDQHVLWSYGTGNVGFGDGELAGPHTADENPLDPDEIVVSEQYGCAILIINRSTGKMRVLYGERGVPGVGERLNAAHSAHFLTAGPYKGHVLMSEQKGEHRIMILERDSGQVLWCCTKLEAPLEAIYWDEDHIMASDKGRGIYKIRLSDKAEVWHYDTVPHGNPFYLQRLFDFCDSYGGDLLASFYGPHRVVQEIDTATSTVAWSYGGRGEQGNVSKERGGDLYDRLVTPVRALRYGTQERGGGLTVIVDERARILCVNRDKELVWELGGASGENLYPTAPYIVLPTYIHVTKRGTFLVTDWGRNMVYEMNPFCIPQRTAKDGCLFSDCETANEFADSEIMESRGYRDTNIQVYNKHSSAGVFWRVLGSHNVRDWQVIHTPDTTLNPGQGDHVLIRGPWNFTKAQAKSGSENQPSKLSVFISLSR